MKIGDKEAKFGITKIIWDALSAKGMPGSKQEGETGESYNARATKLKEMCYSIAVGIVESDVRYVEYRILDKDTEHTVSTKVGGDLRIPTGVSIKSVGAYVDVAGVTGVGTIDINEAGVSILSTKITIDTGEKSSETAETPPVISDHEIDTNAILTFDIDAIQTTPAKGLVVWLEIKLK